MADFYDQYLAERPDVAAEAPAAPAGGGDFYSSYLTEREASPEEKLRRDQAAALAVGRTPEEHETRLRELGVKGDAIKPLVAEFQLKQAKKGFEGQVPGGTIEQFTRSYLPFLGDILDTKGHKTYTAAKKKFEAGDTSPEVINQIARYERLQEIDQKMAEHTGTAAIQAFGSIGRMFVEGAAAGKVMGLAGRAIGGKAGAFLEGATIAKNPAWSLSNPAFRLSLGTHAGRMALMTAGSPSFYVDEARQKNMEAGREVDDIRGYPGSFLHGYSNMLVLGSVAKLFGPGAAKTAVGRLGKGVGVGVGEQQIADVAGGAWDEVVGEAWKTKTRYGVLGDLVRGDLGEAAHHLAVQAVTFGAFGGLHELGVRLDRSGLARAKARMRDASEFLAKEADKNAEAGIPVEKGMERATERMRESTLVRIDAFNKARERGLSEDSALVEADAAEETFRGLKDRSDFENGWRDAYKKAKGKGLSDDSASVEADRTMGEPTYRVPSGEAPVLERAPATQAEAAVAKVSEQTEAKIGKQRKAVYKRVYDAEIKKGRPIEVARALAQQTAAKWEVDARAKAAKAVEKMVPPAAQPPVQATPQSPTIAPVGPKAPVGETPPQAKIVEPGASQEAVSGQEAVQGPVQAPAGPKVSEVPTPPQKREWVPPARRIEEAIDSAAGLTDAQRVEYKAATQSIMTKMPEEALARIAVHLEQVFAHPDALSLGMKAYGDLLRDPTLTPEQRAQVEDSVEKIASGEKVVGGSYTARLNAVYIDGSLKPTTDVLMGRYGIAKGDVVDAAQLHAHEYGHVIDGPYHEFSKSPEWSGPDGAYTKDIKIELKKGAEVKLTVYGGMKSTEGFAEFSRLLYGTDIPTAQIAKDFPNASRFFKDRGLWPPERGPGVGATKKTKLQEAFDQRVPSDESQPTHADLLKKPGARSSTEEAIAPEKVKEEEAAFESEIKDEELAEMRKVYEEKSSVLTADEKDVWESRMSGDMGLEEIARRRGTSRQAVEDLEKAARKKLGVKQSVERTLTGDRTLRTRLVKEETDKLLKQGWGAKDAKAEANRIVDKSGYKGEGMSVSESAEARAELRGEMKSLASRPEKPAKLATDEASIAKMSDEIEKLGQRLDKTDDPDKMEAIIAKMKTLTEKRQAAVAELIEARKKAGLPTKGLTQLMRLSDEPMSETERQMERAIQADPLDETKRLVIADVIEEGESERAAERAAGIRRDVEKPPSERGVSDWRQLSRDQQTAHFGTKRFREIHQEEIARYRKLGVTDREANMYEAQISAIDRYFAEREAAGERLEFKLPEDPNDLTPGQHNISDFGPRLYGMKSEHELLVELGARPAESFPRVSLTNQPHGQTTMRNNGDIVAEYLTERIPSLARLHEGPQWREAYDNGIVEVDGSDGYHGANYRNGLMSVTIKKGHSSFRLPILIETLKDQGFTAVELPNGDTRWDSRIRRFYREQQARGLRTGEPQFMELSMKGLSDAFDKVKAGARSSTWKDVLRKWLTGPGDKPNTVFEQMLDKDNRIREVNQDVTNAFKDLTKAVGNDWATVPPEVKENMWRSRFVPPLLDTFKPEIRVVLKRMWDHVDAMENLLKQEGVISDDLQLKIGHDGPYLTRQHMAFVDPENWYKRVSDKVKNQWIAYRANELRRLEAKNPDLYKQKTPDELQGEMQELLRGKIGKEFINVLAGRKELPQPLSDLLGEVKDPIGSYAYTIGHQARLWSNAVFTRRVKDLGLQEGFLTDVQSSEQFREVGTDKDNGPLKFFQGVYATPEVADSIRSIFGPKSEDPKLLSAYMKVLGGFKYGKTIGSPIAHIRQSLGNLFLVARNGYFRLTEAQARLRDIYDDNQAGRDYVKELIDGNIYDQGVHLGEFRDVAKDALGVKDIFDLSTEMTDSTMTRWLKKVKGGLEKAYRWEDLTAKIVAYENEKYQYAKAYPEWSKEQVRKKAAEIVNAGQMTYSRIGKLVQGIRRLPIVGPFVSFSAEMIRTTYNTARLGWSELQDPRTREIGTRRLTGLVASMGAFAAISAMSRALMGVSLDEEDSIRQMLPEWNKDGQLLHLGKDETGKYRVIDLGRTDPHSFLWEPFQAGITGARTGTGTVYDVLEPLARPFASEELGTRVALDIARNKMERGQGEGQGQVYNPEAGTMDQAGDIGGHIWSGLEPGLVSQTLRTYRGAAGVKNANTGKEYSLGEELLADVSGQRIAGIDPKESMIYKARSFTGRMRNAEAVLNMAAARAGRQGKPVDPAALQASFDQSEAMRRDVFDELLADVRSARLLGLTDQEVAKALKDGGVPQKEIGLILGGRYQERPIREVLQKR